MVQVNSTETKISNSEVAHSFPSSGSRGYASKSNLKPGVHVPAHFVCDWSHVLMHSELKNSEPKQNNTGFRPQRLKLQTRESFKSQ